MALQDGTFAEDEYQDWRKRLIDICHGQVTALNQDLVSVHLKLQYVEKYKNKGPYVTRENAVRLRRNEYFIADLIDLSVFDEDEKQIGTLADVMQTGANDVYVINMTDGRELLLPAIKECILSVDMEERKMVVHILDGLLD